MFPNKAFGQNAALYPSVKDKKLLTIYYKHKPGGLCKRMYMLFEAWVARGGEIHYIAAEPFPVDHPKIIPHVLWSPFQNKEGLFFWGYFICICPIYTFFVALRRQIDIVSVFSGIYGFLALPVKILLKKPLIALARADVYTINCLHHRFVGRIFFEELLMAIGFKSADRVVTVSEQLKNVMVMRYKINSEKIEVLYNNIEDLSENKSEKAICRKKIGLNEEVFLLVSAAVLDPRKNMTFLIKALDYVEKPCVLLIAGDGPERKKLEELSRNVKSSARIIFMGWQDEIGLLLKSADLFIFPTKHEGCPNALLEALSYHVPSIGSDIPEIREILKSDDLLFDLGDVKNLSDKINRVIDKHKHLSRIAELSEEARKRFIFEWDQKITDIHHFFLRGR